MPSQKPNTTKTNQPLTNHRSSGSTELQTYDAITENDNVNNTQRNNKSIENDNQSTSNNNDNNNNSSSKSFWKEIYEKYNPSLTLENKASVARDNLGMLYLAMLKKLS
jgi:hypothetical protein